MSFFADLSPILQALLATCFTWFVTALGAAAVFFFRSVKQEALDAMLAFAAGAMIFVVVEDLIPESQASGNRDIATMGTMLGFAVMMTLDVALG